ncbi:hypothetical protein TPY_2080 [Sulfobacillus acidophilus TPY]|nr:hypothetical protein TPY_2080 [Sulfobacillus acidophilus TPY]
MRRGILLASIITTIRCFGVPVPTLNLLNFTGSWVVVGAPSAAAYEAVNLTSGWTLVNPEQVAPMKGYRGLGLPSRILGLPASDDFPVTIP